MSRVTTKPSKKYSDNFGAIFGHSPTTVAKTKRTYKVYDKERERVIDLSEKPRPERRASLWPMNSYSIGVLPRQAKAAYEASVRAGVPTQFDPKTGDAILESRHHRRRLAESLGMYDLNGGYSDPQQHKERFDPTRDFDPSDYDGI